VIIGSEVFSIRITIVRIRNVEINRYNSDWRRSERICLECAWMVYHR